MKKRYIFSVMVLTVLLSGCVSNDYQKFEREINSSFKNQPILSEYEIAVGDAAFNFSAYQSNVNNQAYLQFGGTEVFSDGKSIWLSNEGGNYVTEYNDSLNEVFGLSESFEYKREPDLELPDGKAKVNRDFLLEYFENPAYYNYNDAKLHDVVYQKDNGLYTIKGQEKTIEFGIKDEQFIANEEGQYGYSIENHKVVTDFDYEVAADPIEISDSQLLELIQSDVEKELKEYENNIEQFYDSNPEAIVEIMKNNKVATAKLVVDEVLDDE